MADRCGEHSPVCRQVILLYIGSWKVESDAFTHVAFWGRGMEYSCLFFPSHTNKSFKAVQLFLPPFELPSSPCFALMSPLPQNTSSWPFCCTCCSPCTVSFSASHWLGTPGRQVLHVSSYVPECLSHSRQGLQTWGGLNHQGISGWRRACPVRVRHGLVLWVVRMPHITNLAASHLRNKRQVSCWEYHTAWGCWRSRCGYTCWSHKSGLYEK